MRMTPATLDALQDAVASSAPRALRIAGAGTKASSPAT